MATLYLTGPRREGFNRGPAGSGIFDIPPPFGSVAPFFSAWYIVASEVLKEIVAGRILAVGP